MADEIKINSSAPTVEDSQNKNIGKDKNKKHLSKKAKIIIAVIVFIIGLIFAYLIYKLPAKNAKTTAPVQKPAVVNKNDTVCPINGVYTTKDMANRRPIGVMIENYPDARPQSGLSNADLVYESVTEGGITRFLAFFQCQNAATIGPVRSARIFFIDWIHELSAFYAHCGGNLNALARIKSDGIMDLDQFANGAYYWRTSRPSPHNLYTSIDKLRSAATSRKYSLTSDGFTSWVFKDDPKLADRPQTPMNVKVNFSSASYLVQYNYNIATNDWTRKTAGVTDTDAATGQPIKVKNAIVQFASITPGPENSVDIQNIGSGNAIFFIDGQATSGTWTKTTVNDRTQYKDSNGLDIKFDRGLIWVEVVNIGTKIEY